MDDVNALTLDTSSSSNLQIANFYSVPFGNELMDLDVVVDGEEEDRLKHEVEHWLQDHCQGAWGLVQVIANTKTIDEVNGGPIEGFAIIRSVEFTDQNDALEFKMRWY